MKQIRASCYLFFVSLGLLSESGLVFAGDDHGIIGKGGETLLLFDAHMHYKKSAWEPFPPNVVLSMMDKNDVAMAHNQTDVVWTAQTGRGGKRIWRSADGGKSWTDCFNMRSNVERSWVQTELKWGYYIVHLGLGADPSNSVEWGNLL